MERFCGIDFGTANSVLFVTDGDGKVRVVREKSVIFIPDSGAAGAVVGTRAVEAYEQSGREGRLLQSLKSILPYTSFKGSWIGGTWWTIESLLALILTHLRAVASEIAGETVSGVVLGRPARFAVVAEEERLAEERLRKAASLAGFEDVRLVLEPVAAAAAYRRSLARPERVLVADLGAGTCDFSVAELVPGAAWASSRVLGNAGVRLGGDNVDGLIMWHEWTPYLGRGTTFESSGKWLDVPARVFRDLCEWERLSFLHDGQTRRDLDLYCRKSRSPAGLRRLIHLIDRDLGYAVFRSVERAKIALAESDTTKIDFDVDGLVRHAELGVTELEEWTGDFRARLLTAARQAMADAGIELASLDSVFLTGGTSLVRPVVRSFAEALGAVKLVRGEPFDSVAAGLLELAPMPGG
jgi:hypothetical chaperone protein